VRAISDETGRVVRRYDYLPFALQHERSDRLRATLSEGGPTSSRRVGEGPAGPTDGDTRRFTGKERDAETGLDYFGARYYAARDGRFTTVDPAMTVEDNLADPQRWNRYAYVRNNPLRYTDPDGRDIWDVVLGALNAAASNLALGAGRTTGGNSDFRFGQVVGDVASIAMSAQEFTAGAGAVTGGVVSCGTGVGCLAGAPAIAAGASVAVHAVGVGAVAGVSLMKSFSEGGDGGGFGNFKKATSHQLQGIDEHAAKAAYVDDISTWNMSVDRNGQVILTPVKKGSAEPINTGLTLEQIREWYPKQ
jgi:RHS repeat-associated protein